jgi:hypothetical protein
LAVLSTEFTKNQADTAFEVPAIFMLFAYFRKGTEEHPPPLVRSGPVLPQKYGGKYQQ